MSSPQVGLKAKIEQSQQFKSNNKQEKKDDGSKTALTIGRQLQEARKSPQERFKIIPRGSEERLKKDPKPQVERREPYQDEHMTDLEPQVGGYPQFGGNLSDREKGPKITACPCDL